MTLEQGRQRTSFPSFSESAPRTPFSFSLGTHPILQSLQRVALVLEMRLPVHLVPTKNIGCSASIVSALGIATYFSEELFSGNLSSDG